LDLEYACKLVFTGTRGVYMYTRTRIRINVNAPSLRAYPS